MTDTSLDFGVLGPLEARAEGNEIVLGTPKQRAVLAMLVINRNRAVSVESLINATWEQWPPAGARATMHQYVSNLRKVIATAGADYRKVLASATPGYRLNIPETASDIGRFVANKTAGMQAAADGDSDEASRRLSAALAEWRGRVLDDLRDFQRRRLLHDRHQASLPRPSTVRRATPDA